MINVSWSIWGYQGSTLVGGGRGTAPSASPTSLNPDQPYCIIYWSRDATEVMMKTVAEDTIAMQTH